MTEVEKTQLANLMMLLGACKTKAQFMRIVEKIEDEAPFTGELRSALDEVLPMLPEKLTREVFEAISFDLGTETQAGRALRWWTVERFKKREE